MWKPPAAILGCCLAALPLIGCAGNVTALRQDGAPVPTAAVAASPAEGVYATGPAMPAAILVFVPGMNAAGRADFLSRDPALWAAQGFDVVMPQPSWSTRLIADQEAALERLLASSRSLADAPIWLVGPGPAIEAAMPQLGPGQISGVVVTSVTSNAGSCSRTMYYSNPGNGAEPKVVVSTAGDACGASPPFGGRRAPSGVVPMPHVHPNVPRIIETSIPADGTAQQAFVQRLAEEIKAPPSS
jgi:hypothetical protein